MKEKVTSILLVLVGLGLGATLLRDQVPTSQAATKQLAKAASSLPKALSPKAEAGAKLQNEQNTIDIVSRYEPGLVYISTEQQVEAQDPFGWMFGGGQQPQVQRGVGSGFFVNAAGDILTNFHVVAGESGELDPGGKISIRVMGSRQTVPAKVIGYAPQYDLALIHAAALDKKFIKPLVLGDSDALRAGQKTIAMGAPFGLDFSVSEGIVSSVSRQIPIGFSGLGSEGAGQGITQKAIQTDAAINPGNSGGPLLDSGGNVIGINTQIFSPSGQSSGLAQSAGVGFAIPVNVARNLLPRLQKAAGHVVLAPKLGLTPGLLAQTGQGAAPVGLSALTPKARQAWHLPETGIVVRAVTPNLPAAKAGIKGGAQAEPFRGGEVWLGGDVITAVGGRPVDGIEDLQAVLIDKKAGDTLTLTVVRGGQSRQVKVTLDASAF